MQESLDARKRSETELKQRIDRMIEKETRERHSSGESWNARSKIFDDKGGMAGELEDTRHKLEYAEAYIKQLEDECQEMEEELKKHKGQVT